MESSELLFEDSIFVIAGIKNPWARRHRIKLADLINEPWAVPPPDNPAHRLLTDVFRAMGLELPRPAMVTAAGVARIALVAKGHFLSMASESVLRFGGWERSIKVLPIDLAANGGVVGIITLKNRTLTPVAQLFNSMYNLGVLYERGIGVTADPVRAKAWYQRAAAHNHPEARAALKRLGA